MFRRGELVEMLGIELFELGGDNEGRVNRNLKTLSCTCIQSKLSGLSFRANQSLIRAVKSKGH